MPTPPSPASHDHADGVRLNKWLADNGVCSRRQADRLMQAGRVTLNGVPVTTLGQRIHPQRDRVCVDGAPLPPRLQVPLTYWAFHKPCGLITTRRDERGRPTIYDALPEALQACDPAGRLDRDSSGLLILSNDGAFLHRLTHPRFHVEKVYRVTVNHPLTPEALLAWRQGVMLHPEGKRAMAVHVAQPGPQTLQLTLVTGYNRQIRRMAQALGYDVRSLKRMAIGPVRLGSLRPGDVRPLSADERERLERLQTLPPSQTPFSP